MKPLLPIMMLVLGLPVCAQTRVVIDNTTEHEVDIRRVHRLTEEALADAGDRESMTLVHIRPRSELQSIAGRTVGSFFVPPNHVFMHDIDYLALVQGVLLTTFPETDLSEIAREGRRIWLEDSLVLRLDEITTEVARSSQ